jgi:phosphatidylserine/phosphatidylglycerophosphate/cardiolipin synthase-like enzyme
MSAKELIKKYCADRRGEHPGETPPSLRQMENHRSKAFIDGAAYFGAIQADIEKLIASTAAGRFFYLTAWWLGLNRINQDLRIDDTWNYSPRPDSFGEFRLPRPPQPLGYQLKLLADSGGMVRILPWVLPFVSNERIVKAAGMFLNFHTLVSVAKIRSELGEESVALNLLSHTFGGAHCKMVVCGDTNSMRAYTSGMDPEAGRLNAPGLSEKEISQMMIGGYAASSQVEINTLCDDLTQDRLSRPLYDVLKRWNQRLPDFAGFVAGEGTGQFYHRIEVLWKDREWKLTFVEQVAPSDYDIDTVHLKREEKYNILFRVFPDGGWHDVGVRVEGRAAGAMHDFFKDMWDEQLGRPVETFNINGRTIVSHDRNWQPLPVRPAIDLAPNAGGQYVQVLRTIPVMNFNLPASERGNLLVPDDFQPVKFGVKGHRIKIVRRDLVIPLGLYAGLQGSYNRRKLSFAPDGCFEFKVALKRAISQAEEYIFIADQSLYALEVMDWINGRLGHKPNLKVILLYGADPADPPNDFLSEAINQHLLPGVARNSDDNLPGNIVLYEWSGNAVHCKVTIIDDVWCAIGSANCMRRSLYTDIELSVSILEPKTADDELPANALEEANPVAHQKSAPSFVQQFRRDLWAHYCGIPLDPAKRSDRQQEDYTRLLSLKHAFSPWNPVRWRARLARSAFHLRPEITRQNLDPFPIAGNFDQTVYNRQDPDSRMAF